MTTDPLPPPNDRPRVERLTYSVEESAHALGVSRPTIYRMVARRMLTPVAGLRHKRIPCQQIRRLIAATDAPGRN